MRRRDVLIIFAWSALLAGAISAGIAYTIWANAQPPQSVGELHRQTQLSWLQGDIGNARAMVNRLIRYNPRDVDAWMMRGILRYHAGDLESAARDFAQVQSQLAHAPPQIDLAEFAALYEWLAVARSGSKDQADDLLRSHLTRDSFANHEWPREIALFLLGERDVQTLLQGAVLQDVRDTGLSPPNGHLCEAHFYAGSKALIVGGDQSVARQHFLIAVQTNAVSFYEYGSAVDELRTMQAMDIDNSV